MAGPRFSYRGNERVTPFAHALIGLDHIRLSGEAEGEGELMRNTNNGLGFALGGGLDVNLSESVAIRLIQADYYLTRHEGDSMNNMNLAFGVVFRIGQ
jgi:opacity protein-like surface antigen